MEKGKASFMIAYFRLTLGRIAFTLFGDVHARRAKMGNFLRKHRCGHTLRYFSSPFPSATVVLAESRTLPSRVSRFFPTFLGIARFYVNISFFAFGIPPILRKEKKRKESLCATFSAAISTLRKHEGTPTHCLGASHKTLQPRDIIQKMQDQLGS